MSPHLPETFGLEPERYELHAQAASGLALARRDFCKLLGGGLLVLLYLDELLAQESGRGGRGRRQALPKDLAAWLHIGQDGTITVFTGKVEVGQNARTSLTQVVAEELAVPLGTIHLIMGDTDRTPFDMGTFGSQTTPTMVPQLRKVAAAARESLIDLAAEQFKTDRQNLTATEGRIVERGQNRSMAFGELTKGQELTRTVAEDIPLIPAPQWRVAGTSVPKVDAESFVTGKHKYTPDVAVPEMIYGKVLRPPAFGASLVSVDTKDAEAMAGVKVVHEHEGSFVGVVAPTSALADRALKAIHAEWKTVPQPSERELFELLKKGSREGGGRFGSVPESGSVEQGMAEADHKLHQTYTVAYIAHIPLETRAAVAEWKDGKLTVWTGTQRPFGVRSELMQVFDLAEDKVRVIMPDTGSGYGGKHTGEAAVEAARLARGAGRPVKLVWTREEEFTWAYFRPAGVIEITSGARKDGTITAWEFHNYNSGASGIRAPYSITNQKTQFHNANSPLRQGSYRALAATANHFARETHIDELAHEVGMDPLTFRLHNLTDTRLQDVLSAAAKAFGWSRNKPEPGHGVGISVGFEKGSRVATCAEVAVDGSGNVRVVRAVEAFECGAVIDPDHLTNQIQGAMMMGLGGALFEAIHFDDGKILNPRLAKYRVPRFSDMPKIEVVLVNRKDLPSVGAGETPIVGIAPAVGNAIFNATGRRLRSMPMAPEGLPS
jgi:isoquinoline 1-oxidoreductase